MSSKIRLFGLVFRHEWRLLLAEKSLWLVLALLFSVLAYGLYNGINATESRAQIRAALLQQEAEAQTGNLARLKRILAGDETPDPFANPANPANVGSGGAARYAIMPALPLAPLAFGQSDMLPDHYKISYRNKTTFMYDGEIENPWNLLSGRLDAAFVIIYLLPLLIFALSYNLLSAEREQGTLKLLLSNPLSLRALLLGKLLARMLPLLAGAALLPLLLLVIFHAPARSPAAWPLLAAWALLTVAYGLFWFALAAWVNALGRPSATNALMLIATWVTLTLIAPVVLNVLVATASPAPSRIELSTRTRLVTIDGLNRYNDLLSTDYRYTAEPETLRPKEGKLTVPERLRAHYLMAKDVDEAIQGLLTAFDQQVAGQQALVDRFGFISPAIVAAEGVTGLAGNGSRRYGHFKAQMEAYHHDWRAFFEPRVLNGLAMSEADFAALPRFTWQEESARAVWQDLALRGLQLLIPAALIALFALRRLRRYQVV